MFYSPSTGGFYEEGIHGSRRITIIEPAWQRPTIDVTLQPGESYTVAGQLVVNETADPMQLGSVPDMDAVPATIEIDNPDCKIPADAVQITAEHHAALIDGQSLGKRIIADANGHPVLADPPPLTVAELKANKLAEISARCESEIAAIKSGYPDGEVLSWPKQETEARAYTADANAATPLLDALALARGITKADLASRVILKADMFAQISGAIIGKRQALEDQINALPANATAADLDAIQW